MMRELQLLWGSLHDPEYLHLLLEPLPLFGLGLGFLFLGLSMILEHKHTRLFALVIVMLSACSVHWYLQLRLASEPRISATTGVAVRSAIEQQTQRRNDTAWIYYTVAGTCLVALVFGNSSSGGFLNYIAMAMVACGFVHALWLHKKECEVYHPHILHYAPPR